MGVRRWLLALLLLWLALGSASGEKRSVAPPATKSNEEPILVASRTKDSFPISSASPLSEATDGKEPMEGYTLNLVHPKEVRSIGGHRHNGWRKYRRPRPRLSHKGPMPF